MFTRRRFLVGSGSALALVGALGPRALRAEGLKWTAYTIAIDGAGGLGRMDDPDDGTLSAGRSPMRAPQA